VRKGRQVKGGTVGSKEVPLSRGGEKYGFGRKEKTGPMLQGEGTVVALTGYEDRAVKWASVVCWGHKGREGKRHVRVPKQ